MVGLEIDGVSLRFGGVQALQDVSFSVPSGQFCALVGPNGAGKSSLFNCISGLYRATAGSVRLGEQELAGRRPHETAQLGVARTFQNLALVPEMSVLDNVMLGAQGRGRFRPLAAVLRTRPEKNRIRELSAAALEELELLGIADKAATAAGDLAFGIAKRVELARAAIMHPQLLLVDEPAGGLTADELDKLAAQLRKMRDERDLTVILVEHHMGFVASLAERVVVLDEGQLIADGTPTSIAADPAVIEAYLGGAA